MAVDSESIRNQPQHYQPYPGSPSRERNGYEPDPEAFRYLFANTEDAPETENSSPPDMEAVNTVLDGDQTREDRVVDTYPLSELVAATVLPTVLAAYAGANLLAGDAGTLQTAGTAAVTGGAGFLASLGIPPALEYLRADET